MNKQLIEINRHRIIYFVVEHQQHLAKVFKLSTTNFNELDPDPHIAKLLDRSAYTNNTDPHT